MTDTYKAGEIEITVKLDASDLKGQFDAMRSLANKEGGKIGKTYGQAIGKTLISGFKAGQFGKQINKVLEEQMKTGSPKLLAAFKEIGLSGGKELVTAYLKETGKINTGVKAKFSKVGGLMKAGLKGLAKGGAIGLAMEAANYVAGKTIEGVITVSYTHLTLPTKA